MLEQMKKEIEENCKLFYPTLKNLHVDEITNIWDKVSEFVHHNLCMNKGVQIPGLGIFSFARIKLDLSGNKFLVTQKPVFLLSEKLCQAYRLKQRKKHTPGEIPIVPLNIVIVSLESSLRRDVVQDCLRETLLYLLGLIVEERPITFLFNEIGILRIQNEKVHMTFFKEFLKVMDRNGKLVKILPNKPVKHNSTRPSSTMQRESASGQIHSPSHKARPVTFPSIEKKETEKNSHTVTMKEENDVAKKEKPIMQTEKHPHNTDKKAILDVKKGSHISKKGCLEETQEKEQPPVTMLEQMKKDIMENRKDIYPTLQKLSVDEITKVWDKVFDFVYQNLSTNKGVHISGMGLFSFEQTKLDLGGNKFIVTQRPIFLLSEKHCQAFGLKQSKKHSPGEIRIVPLNIMTVSLESSLRREIVQDCLRETLLYLLGLIAAEQPVAFVFNSIGILQIHNKNVHMTFFKEFLEAMDGSGKLAKAISIKPATADSVRPASGQISSPSHEARPLVFPSIEQKKTEKKGGTVTIKEGTDMTMKEKPITQTAKDLPHNADKNPTETLPEKRLLHLQTPDKTTRGFSSNVLDKRDEKRHLFERAMEKFFVLDKFKGKEDFPLDYMVTIDTMGHIIEAEAPIKVMAGENQKNRQYPMRTC
ncbi:hypothetical protein Y1Q_0005324 [Alligator mississippiensis]|uniref:Coiled-coil domain-containing protein 81 n=1 Tax=Alligator mississippiensis TaxID=8496 RepID=A0A151MVQ4_ALLMI|nr:hypothetical protein Y1Q_0005324 [Alligator mississippiensis]